MKIKELVERLTELMKDRPDADVLIWSGYDDPAHEVIIDTFGDKSDTIFLGLEE